MKILFEFSRSGLDQHLGVIKKIRETILTEGHQLTRDLLAETTNHKKPLPSNVFEKLTKAISEADCVIIEGSSVSISLGYVLTKALNLGKPVLFLCDQMSGNGSEEH